MRRIGQPRLKVLKVWCREILKGLEYLHTSQVRPVIHRDIKCENIFINSNTGEIRIGDLGLATMIQNSFTKSVLGTPEFMAPEIYDEKYGPGCDIYAFGMSVLEIATQKTPYRECQNPAQIYKKVISGIKPEDLKLIQNQELKNFIELCLSDEINRPTSSQLLQHEFLKIDPSQDNILVALSIPNSVQNSDAKSKNFQNVLLQEESSEPKQYQSKSIQQQNQEKVQEIKLPVTQQLQKKNCDSPSFQQNEIQQQQQQKQQNQNFKNERQQIPEKSSVNAKPIVKQLEQSHSLRIQETQQESVKMNEKGQQQLTQNKNEKILSNDYKIPLHQIKNSITQELTEKPSLQKHSSQNSPNTTTEEKKQEFLEKQMELLIVGYKQYLQNFPTEYFQTEAEERMEYRHKREQLLLNKLHLMQRECHLKQNFNFLNFLPKTNSPSQNITQQQKTNPSISKPPLQQIPKDKQQQQSITSQKTIPQQSQAAISQKNSQQQQQQQVQQNIKSVQLQQPQSQTVQQTVVQQKPVLSSPPQQQQLPIQQKNQQQQQQIKVVNQNCYIDGTPKIQIKTISQPLSEASNTSTPQNGSKQKHSFKFSVSHQNINQLKDLEQVKPKKQNMQLLSMLIDTKFEEELGFGSMETEKIKLLQLCLNELVAEDVIVCDNGLYRKYTENLVKSVQAKFKIKPTGIVDQLTWDTIVGEVQKLLTKNQKQNVPEKNYKQIEFEEKQKKLRESQNLKAQEALNNFENELKQNTLNLK